MTQMTAYVKNCHGIHVRPSNVIINHVADYAGEIWLSSSKGESNLRSILELISLALEHGTRITICVSGPNEAAVCQELVDLFETEFDFPMAE